jgi:hypothetical protein
MIRFENGFKFNLFKKCKRNKLILNTEKSWRRHIAEMFEESETE